MVDFSNNSGYGSEKSDNGMYSLEQIKKMIAQERPFVDTSCRYERTRMTVFSWRDYRDFLNNLTAIVSQHPDTIPEVIPLLKKMPAYCRIRPIAEAKAKCVKMIMYKNKNYASECLDVLFDEMRFNFDEFGRTIEIKDVLYSGINNVIHNSDSPEIAEKVLNFYQEIQPEEKKKVGEVDCLMGFVARGLNEIAKKYPEKDQKILDFIRKRIPENDATFHFRGFNIFDVWENIASHGKDQSQQVWMSIKPFIRKMSLEAPLGDEKTYSKSWNGCNGKWLDIKLLSCVVAVCEQNPEKASEYINYFEKNNALGVMDTLKTSENLGNFISLSGIRFFRGLLKRVKPFIANNSKESEILARINKSVHKAVIKSRCKSEINDLINYNILSQYNLR